MDKEPIDKPPLPVTEMLDMLLYGQTSADHPARAFYTASEMLEDRIRALTEGENAATPAIIEEMTHGLALSRQLLYCSAFADFGDLQGEIASDPDNCYSLERHREELVVKGVDVTALQARAERFTTRQTLEYFTARLEAWHDHLATGAEMPDRSLVRPYKELIMADALGMAVQVLPETVAEQQLWRQRFGMAIANMSQLLLEHNKLGLGIAFGDLNKTAEWSHHFIPLLVEKIKDLRTIEGEESHRTLYNYAVSRLHEPLSNIFLARLAKEPTESLFGSQVSYGGGFVHGYRSERFEEGRLRWAKLSDGTPLPLPEICYRTRTVWGYDTTNELERYESQQSVDYQELSDAERTAVDIALLVEDSNLLQVEITPRYKRVALRPAEEDGELYSVLHRKGRRSLNDRSDHGGYSMNEKQRYLDRPIQSMETVSDSHLVTHYNGGYMHEATYQDAELNFFGPKDTAANAFWVMGGPRRIISKTDQRLILPGHRDLGRPEPRFIIMPIRFLRIIEAE